LAQIVLLRHTYDRFFSRGSVFCQTDTSHHQSGPWWNAPQRPLHPLLRESRVLRPRWPAKPTSWPAIHARHVPGHRHRVSIHSPVEHELSRRLERQAHQAASRAG